jgi:hypothetical protein
VDIGHCHWQISGDDKMDEHAKKKTTETASSVRVHCTIEVGLEGFEIVTVSIRLLLLFITNSSRLYACCWAAQLTLV